MAGTAYHPDTLSRPDLGRLLDPIGACMTPDARSQRVTILVLAAALMSLGDLYMTLTYVMSIGMVEVNPIARHLMSMDSPLPVVLFKVSLTLFGTTVLMWFRRRRAAEIAAWFVFLGMTILTMHWRGYSTQVAEMTEEYQALTQVDDPRFVQMEGW